MSAEWYCRIDGTDFGPLGAADLKRMAESGKLRPVDLVRKSEAGKWIPASSVRGLTFDTPPPTDSPASGDGRGTAAKRTGSRGMSWATWCLLAFLTASVGGLASYVLLNVGSSRQSSFVVLYDASGRELGASGSFAQKLFGVTIYSGPKPPSDGFLMTFLVGFVTAGALTGVGGFECTRRLVARAKRPRPSDES